jgi:type I restriction enzyme S subunit
MKAGWKTVKLGEACKIVNGATPSTSVEANWGGPHCWITPAEMGGLSDPYVSKTRRTLTDAGLADCSASLLPTGSVILSSRAPIGHVIINTVPMATNQGCKSMIPRSDLDAKFLFYFIKANVPLLESLGTGATFKELSGGKLASVEIPLPNLAEQKRIVALLDEAFARIDEAKGKTEANLLESQTLLESHLESAFTQNLADRKDKPLSELCERITKGSSPKWQGISYIEAPGVLFVTSENVGECEIHLDEPKYVEEKFNLKDKKSILKKGDVLTNIVGASIGRTAVFDRDDVANINQAVCLLRCRPDVLNNYYLAYLLNSPVFKRMLHENEIDTARANLSLGFFSKLVIPAPSLTRQNQVVANIETFRQKARHLRKLYYLKVANLDDLKKSILQKSFAGELTA